MAKKKCKCPPEGAPLWVLTYGDMMSLLLCFFILLVALSEIKKEEFRVKAEAIKSSFVSSTRGGGPMVTDIESDMNIIEPLDQQPVRRDPLDHHSRNEDEGMEGTTATVTRIREGILEPVGGPIAFEPGSAELTPEAIRRIHQLVPRIRGELNKLEIRGHASPVELAYGSDYPDLWSLSHARARAVMAYLVSDAVGIRADRIRLTASADHEPLRHRLYSPGAQEPNRRVEIIVMEAIVDDLSRPEVTESR